MPSACLLRAGTVRGSVDRNLSICVNRCATYIMLVDVQFDRIEALWFYRCGEPNVKAPFMFEPNMCHVRLRYSFEIICSKFVARSAIKECWVRVGFVCTFYVFLFFCNSTSDVWLMWIPNCFGFNSRLMRVVPSDFTRNRLDDMNMLTPYNLNSKYGTSERCWRTNDWIHL